MTTENIFSAVLTLSLLAGGAVAFGSDAASKQTAPARAETIAVVTLPTVTVVGRRAAPTMVAAADVVTLPTVTVVGRRAPTKVAIETHTVDHRVQ